MNTDTLTLTDVEKLAMLNKIVRMTISTINGHIEDESRPVCNWKVELAIGAKEDIKFLRNEVFARGTEENEIADGMLRAVRKIRDMAGANNWEALDPIEIFRV